MTRPAVLVLLASLALGGAAARAQTAPAAAATSVEPAAATEDIKAAYEQGDYQETLRLLGRVLALKGRSAEGYDRYALLMLRAESHLKLKATSGALSALEEAAKVAAAAKDDKAAADARALTILIKRSKALQYTPRFAAAAAAAGPGPGGAGGGEAKARPGGPIDITDPKRRGEALEALYNEEKAAAKPKVMEADRAKKLVPIADALKAVAPLKELELAATGKDAETTEMVKDLVDRARTLMAKGLDDMTRRTARIGERANELMQYTVSRRDGTQETRTSRRGIQTEEKKELKQTVEECKRIIESCKQLAEQFPDEADPFEDLQDQARETGENAHDVLTDNYSKIR